MRKINTKAVIQLYLVDNIFSLKYLSAITFVVAYFMPSLIKLNQASSQTQLRIHFAVLLILISERWNVLIFFLGFLLIISNVPFKQNIQQQLLIRTGKLHWLFNQVIYLFFIAIAYFTSTLILMCLWLFQSIGFFANWGQFLGGLSHNDGQLNSLVPHSLYVSRALLEHYSPFYYCLIFCLLMIILLFLFALFVFVGNLYFNFSGLFIAGGILFLNLYAYGAASFNLFYVSPITWTSIHLINNSIYSNYPSWFYIIRFILFLLIILFSIIVLKGKSNSTFDYS